MSETGFDELREGQAARQEYAISDKVYEGFLAAFGDRNALHVDESYAAAKGFPGKVMHGAILNGFISAFVGMRFPGKNSLLQSVKIDFKRPNFLNDTVALEAIVEQKVESVRTVVLKVTIRNLTRNYDCASARVQVGML